MNFKALFPNFGAISQTKWDEPDFSKKNLGSILLVIIMIVAVFLPWLRFEMVNPDKQHDLLTDNQLGITSWYGIVGFVGALITAYGVLYKQHAVALWGSVLAVVMGYIGATSYADVKVDDYVVFKESLESFERNGEGLPVTHIGANIFLLAASICAVMSFIKASGNACETKAETSSLSKAGFVLSLAITVILSIESFMYTTTCLSSLALNIITWNLPLICILIVTYCYINDKKESRSNTLNLKSFGLLFIAFIFTNSLFIESKCTIEDRTKLNSIITFKEIEQTTYKDKEEEKELEEKYEDAIEDGYVVLGYEQVHDSFAQLPATAMAADPDRR